MGCTVEGPDASKGEVDVYMTRKQLLEDREWLRRDRSDLRETSELKEAAELVRKLENDGQRRTRNC